MRVLKWIVERAHGEAFAIESPLGWMPRYEDMDWAGEHDVAQHQFYELMSINKELWKSEILLHEELFIKLYDRLPKEFILMRDMLLLQLWRSPKKWETHYKK